MISFVRRALVFRSRPQYVSFYYVFQYFLSHKVPGVKLIDLLAERAVRSDQQKWRRLHCPSNNYWCKKTVVSLISKNWLNFQFVVLSKVRDPDASAPGITGFSIVKASQWGDSPVSGYSLFRNIVVLSGVGSNRGSDMKQVRQNYCTSPCTLWPRWYGKHTYQKWHSSQRNIACNWWQIIRNILTWICLTRGYYI
jgi:hypothetical protein